MPELEIFFPVPACWYLIIAGSWKRGYYFKNRQAGKSKFFASNLNQDYPWQKV